MSEQTLQDRLIEGAVWAVSTADHWAAELGPRRIEKLYKAAMSCRDAADRIATLEAQLQAAHEVVADQLEARNKAETENARLKEVIDAAIKTLEICNARITALTKGARP